MSAHEMCTDVIVVQGIKNAVNDTNNKGWAMVTSSCATSVMRGANVYSEGMVGASRSTHAGDTVAVYADICDACTDGQMTLPVNKMYLGTGVLNVSRKRWHQLKSACKKRTSDDTRRKEQDDDDKHGGSGTVPVVTMSSRVYQSPSLHDLPADVFFLQNLPSCLVAHVLIQYCTENTRLLDMCAAPGGKTTHIASLLRRKYPSPHRWSVTALDRNVTRVNKMIDVIDRQGLHDVISVHHADAVHLCDPPDGDHLRYPSESFDVILLDAPCSGTGQRPRFSLNMTNKELDGCARYQRLLIDVAIRLLKPGGVLLYSTCSISPLENEENALWLLKQYPDTMKIIPCSPRLGMPGVTVHGDGDTQALSMMQRFMPGLSQLDCIGFFMSLFVKV